MVKKSCIIILIALVLLMSASCGLDYRKSLSEDLHNQVQLKLGETNNKPEYVSYLGNKYQFVEEPSFIEIDKYKEDVLVSWNGYRYVGYVDLYYSNTLNNPLFIYYKTWLFLQEEYDYLTDTFVIDGTTEEIMCKDIFGSEQINISFENPIEINLYSKQCNRIKAKLALKCVANQWYVSYTGAKKVWIVSDEFKEILLENSII